MPIFSIPANVTIGGIIQSTDVSTLYNAINGSLDNQNIKVGGITGANLANNTVAIGQIKNTFVSTGVAPGVAKHSNAAYVVMPSGAYSFYPGISTDASGTSQATFGMWVTVDNPGGGTFDVPGPVSANGLAPPTGGFRGMSYIQGNTTPQAIMWQAIYNSAVTGNTSVCTLTAYYIQSSPPYDLGDGEIPLFVFVRLDADGTVVGTYIAQDPPWAHATKKKMRLPDDPKKMIAEGRADELIAALEQNAAHAAAARGLLKQIEQQKDPAANQQARDSLRDIRNLLFEPISDVQAEKNSDMASIPHPWVVNDEAGHTVAMLDPMSKTMEHISALHESGEKVTELLHHGLIKVGDAHDKRKGPPGVRVVHHGFKNTR